ncbi:hypothetical protein HAX54_034906, partial [Datura stramonium]|nr:hypothetical protein [Datura stramonium]
MELGQARGTQFSHATAGAQAPFSSTLAGGQQHSPRAMGHAQQHWMRQQLGATRKRLPMPKNG